MRSQPSYRPFVVAVPAILAAAGALLLALLGSDGAAEADEKLVAASVCEAHELRARQVSDPSLEVEIPQEFDKPWPTREACLSHEAAGDPEAPGPQQPIQFSHKHHAGLYGIDCLYCHAGSDRSQAAGVPSVELCMGCHSQFPSSYDELEGIRTLKDHWGIEVTREGGGWKSLPRDESRARPIQWEQIHRLPEHVQFRHNRHVQAGFDCQQCHGAVEEMDKLHLVPETHWWPWLLPTQKLEMGWCINCHRDNGASQDCYTCHY
jgi:hypothetical protein